MSSIDNRIVDMKFNNAAFNSGVQKTLSFLDRLKSALNFGSATKGLKTLNAETKRFDLNNIGAAVDNIQKKFSIFGVAGATVIATLSHAVVQLGTQMYHAFVDPIVEGGKKRALNIEQAKFQFKGLKMNVETAMSDALFAVKDTAFGLDEAARAAAQFGASGVKSGKDMRNALRGISGVAAMAGASYEDIAGIFTKVAGQGRLMGDDLNRLGVRGINGAAVLAKALGKTEADVRKLASDGKISFAMFSKAMSDAFGEHATKANETYTGAISNMRAALSRLGADYYSVKHENMRKSINALIPIIDKFKKSLGPLYMLFKDISTANSKFFIKSLGKINFTDIIDSMKHVSRIIRHLYGAVISFIKPIGAAFNTVFPPSTNLLTKITRGLDHFTKKLILSKDAQKKLQAGAVAVFKALKIGVSVVMGLARWIGDTVVFVVDLGTAIGRILGILFDFFYTLGGGAKTLDGASSGIKKFADFINKIRVGGFDKIIKGVNSFADGLENLLTKGKAPAFVDKFHASLSPLNSKLKSVKTGLSGLANSAWDFVKNISLKPAIEAVGNFGSAIKNRIGNAFSSIKESFGPAIEDFGRGLDNLKAILGGVWKFIMSIQNGIGTFSNAIGTSLGELFGGVGKEEMLAAFNIAGLVALFRIVKDMIGTAKGFSGFKKSIVGAIDSFSGVLGQMQKDIKSNLIIKIAASILLLAVALLLVSTIDPGRLISAGVAMSILIISLVSAMAGLSDIKGATGVIKLIGITAAMTVMAGAILILAAAVKVLGGMSYDDLARGLGAVILLMGALVASALLLSKAGVGLIPAAAGLNIMAGALLLLSGVVMILGAIPYSVLEQGLTAVMALLVGLTATSLLLAPQGPKILVAAIGLMAMAAALNMLVIPIITLGLLPMDVLNQGLNTLVAILMILIAAAYTISTIAPKMVLAAVGLMAIATAINMLVAPIVLLGTIDMAVLAQGLGALVGVLAVLVLAAMAMSGAVLGAAGIVAIAAGLLLLSIALQTIGEMSPTQIATSLIALAGALIIFGVASAVLSPTIPAMLTMAIALGIFAVSMLIVSAAMVVFSLGLLMLAPALLIATASLLTFAAMVPVIAEAAPGMASLGMALIVFGTGALTAGAGALALGAGLIVLGVGLAIVGAIGAIGAAALTLVSESVAKLTGKIPKLLLMAGAFTILGAAVIVLGAGLLVLGASLVVIAAGLFGIIVVGPQASASIDLVQGSLERFIAQGDGLKYCGDQLRNLGLAIDALSASSNSAESPLASAASAMDNLGVAVDNLIARTLSGQTLIPAAFIYISAEVESSSRKIDQSLRTANVSVNQNIIAMAKTFTLGATTIDSAINKLIDSVNKLADGISASIPTVKAAAYRLVSELKSTVVSGVTSAKSSFSAAGADVGSAISSGMAQGIRNNSSSVTSAARETAAAALKAAKDELGVKSPSKAFEEVGMYSDEGLAQGLLKYSTIVIDSAETVSSNALDTMKKVLSDSMFMFDSEIETNPVIKPIVDMSNVRTNAALLSGMFNGQKKIDLSSTYNRAAQIKIPNRHETESITQLKPANTPASVELNYTQTINSPKNISRLEIYRQTNNQLNALKRGLAE